MYGHAFSLDTLTLNNNHCIALMGIDDSKEERKALLTVLTPNKISGVRSGTLFHDYKILKSDAEECVINFTRTELESA